MFKFPGQFFHLFFAHSLILLGIEPDPPAGVAHDIQRWKNKREHHRLSRWLGGSSART